MRALGYKFDLLSTWLNLARQTEFSIILPRGITNKEKLERRGSLTWSSSHSFVSHLRKLDIQNVLFSFLL